MNFFTAPYLQDIHIIHHSTCLQLGSRDCFHTHLDSLLIQQLNDRSARASCFSSCTVNVPNKLNVVEFHFDIIYSCHLGK